MTPKSFVGGIRTKQVNHHQPMHYGIECEQPMVLSLFRLQFQFFILFFVSTCKLCISTRLLNINYFISFVYNFIAVQFTLHQDHNAAVKMARGNEKRPKHSQCTTNIKCKFIYFVANLIFLSDLNRKIDNA